MALDAVGVWVLYHVELVMYVISTKEVNFSYCKISLDSIKHFIV